MKSLISSLIGFVLSISVSAEPLVEGRVRLDSGELVADAQVRLFDLTDLRQGAIARATTDGTGYFALPLAALGGHALPQGFALGPNYPNPFNPSTIIPYQLAALSEVRLEVFNLLGQRIATLVDGARPAGSHTAMWNATDAAGRAVGAGVYIYRMTVGAASQTGRMVLVDGQAGVAASGVASVWSGAAGSGLDGVGAQVYGLIVSGEGLVPYVDSSFRVEAGMAPVELVVSEGPYSAGKVTDDDCTFCDLFDAFNAAEDLIVYASVSKTVLTPGEAFTLRAKVQNQGTDEFQDLVLSYYRSSDATISTQDMLLGTDEVGNLAASGTSGNESISLTASSTSGTSYYGACVASVSDEGDTLNHCSTGVRVIVADEADRVHIPDANLRAAIETALGKASGATITVADMTRLTTLLRADEAGISDLTGLEFATNLTKLFLQFNSISDISPLSGLTNLRELSLIGNNISDISPLSGLTNLRELWLRGNNISDISPLSGLTNLRELWLSTNDISDISPLSGLTNLRELELLLNRITDISPLSGLTNLTDLYLWSNDITDVSALRGLTNLVRLDLFRNNITDVSALRGLTRLIVLELSTNDITDVSALRGLTRLRRLGLSTNNITDVSPLSGLTNLTELNLASNNISDISPLRSLTNLTELSLNGQPLSASSINDHIPALQSSGATVLFDPLFRESDFDIELVFLDDHLDKRDKRVIRYAARRWMSIIREDLPDYKFTQGWSGPCGDQSYAIPSGERIDDLRIYVVSFNDYDGAPEGWASPRVLRETSDLSVVGCMGFNLSHNVSISTALHEIGHVLGIGTSLIWDDLIQDPNGDPHFNGPRAIAAFNDAGGRNYIGKKVPLEEDRSHWRRPVLIGEIMEPITGVRVSAITIQALADIGYSVDVTQADPYTLYSAAAKASAKVAAHSTHAEPKPVVRHRHRQQQEPIYVVDPQGRIVRTLHR